MTGLRVSANHPLSISCGALFVLLVVAWPNPASACTSGSYPMCAAFYRAAGILVTLDSSEKKYAVRSDLRGRYDLDVTPGSYIVRVQPPPNFDAVPTEKIVVRAGECVTSSGLLKRRPREER